MTPPRDTDPLELSTHGMQMMRDRNIGAFEIKKAIETGEVTQAKRDNFRYRLEFPGPDLLVIVDPERMKIVSVFYDDEQGAVGGGI